MRSARKLIPVLRARDGDNCGICGKPIDFSRPPGFQHGPSVDHVIPRAAGGYGHQANLQLAHAYPCNHAKGASWDGRNWAAVHDPSQTPDAIRLASERRAARRNRLAGRQLDLVGIQVDAANPVFESWSAARPW